MEKPINTLHSSNQHEIKLNADHAIDFAPKPRSSRSYGITIKYYNDGNEEVKKRLDYQIQLQVNQFRDEPKTWQLCFNKADLFIDQHQPDLVSEQLASMAMAAIYPVKVDVNVRNEIFRGIVNHQEIVDQWKYTAEKINDKYEGELTELFLKKMNQKINDRFELESALHLDMFWSMFFHPQYLKYEPNLNQEISFNFPVMAYKGFVFDGQQSIEPYYTDYGTYKVAFRSTHELTEEQSTQMRINHANKMSLHASWDLDKDGGLLKHATVDWNIYQETRSERFIQKRITFSAYEIENKSVANNDSLIQEADFRTGQTEKKKGFWARIMN